MAKFSRGEIRKILGDVCTDEIENQLVALHLGVVDPLKDDLAKYKADAEKLESVEAELNTLKNKPDDGYKEKYEKEHSDFEAYKQDVEAKATRAVKEKAVRAYFEGKNITGTNLEIAMKGAKEEIDALVMEGDKIKDTKALDDLVAGTYAGLVVKTMPVGAPRVNPPANNPAPEKPVSRAAELAAKYHENLYGKAKE